MTLWWNNAFTLLMDAYISYFFSLWNSKGYQMVTGWFVLPANSTSIMQISLFSLALGHKKLWWYMWCLVYNAYCSVPQGKVCDFIKHLTAVMQHQWRVWKSLKARKPWKVEGITVWWEGFCGLTVLPQAALECMGMDPGIYAWRLCLRVLCQTVHSFSLQLIWRCLV